MQAKDRVDVSASANTRYPTVALNEPKRNVPRRDVTQRALSEHNENLCHVCVDILQPAVVLSPSHHLSRGHERRPRIQHLVCVFNREAQMSL